MKNLERTAPGKGSYTTDNNIIPPIADDVALLLFVRHSITAAVAGRRLLSKKEWNKTHSEIMKKCSIILDGCSDE